MRTAQEGRWSVDGEVSTAKLSLRADYRCSCSMFCSDALRAAVVGYWPTTHSPTHQRIDYRACDLSPHCSDVAISRMRGQQSHEVDDRHCHEDLICGSKCSSDIANTALIVIIVVATDPLSRFPSSRTLDVTAPRAEYTIMIRGDGTCAAVGAPFRPRDARPVVEFDRAIQRRRAADRDERHLDPPELR